MSKLLPGIPLRDKDWLIYIRSLRCTLCGRNGIPIRPHHAVHIKGFAGKSIKAPDCLTVPLCDRCHGEYSCRPPTLEEREQMNERLVYLLMEYLGRRLTDEERF